MLHRPHVHLWLKEKASHRTASAQKTLKKKKTERVKEGVAASLFISSQRGAHMFVGQTKLAKVLSDDW